MLQSDSHLSKKIALFATMEALENDEIRILFHLKSSFLSEDLHFFVLTQFGIQ